MELSKDKNYNSCECLEIVVKGTNGKLGVVRNTYQHKKTGEFKKEFIVHDRTDSCDKGPDKLFDTFDKAKEEVNKLLIKYKYGAIELPETEIDVFSHMEGH